MRHMDLHMQQQANLACLGFMPLHALTIGETNVDWG